METNENSQPPADGPDDEAQLIASLADHHVADVVEALNAQPPEVAASVLAQVPLPRAIEVFDQPQLNAPAALIQMLPVERAVKLLNGLSHDRAADIFRNIEEPARSTLMDRLDRETRNALRHVLHFPTNTAGSLMTTEFVSVLSDITAGEALNHIRQVERTRETIYAIYVLNPETKVLEQAVSLRRLLIADPATKLADIMPQRKPVMVEPLAGRDEVTRLISKYDLLAVPVVDSAGHVAGIVTVDDVIDAIIEEGTEDVQRFGGVQALEEPYMQIGFWMMIRKRAGWLCALFLSEMLTASAMQHFEGELEKAVVLTLFIPLIMSSGGNSGSQATSLIIRALALREINLRDWWRIALREIPMGLTLGVILGVIGIIRITVWQKTGIYSYGAHWPLIAITVGAALTAIVMFGSLIGSMLPFALKRLGFDPASASAPFVATFIDVTGLVIYFSVAYVILQGTLL